MSVERPKISRFPDEILEHIAQLISETRSGSEITRFFRAADYPEFVHDGSTKKWFVLDCLRNLNNRRVVLAMSGDVNGVLGKKKSFGF